MKTITIQPKEQEDFKLPYPFHISEDGSVGRQDFWKGKPQRLLGFNNKPEAGDIKLFGAEFRKNPKLAIGMYPVFKNKGGGWVTHTIPIESVRVNKD
ncbi:hypothetical protein LCGC14_0958260 [marine sediment metagenome]|uniref:Uncharacterized protein n=1 Tax=marine sediment metagenome TaxID=412755 RepID=A0A0F9NF57_9ZZZZ